MRASGVDGVMLGRATLAIRGSSASCVALMEERVPEPIPAAPRNVLRFAIHHYHAMVEEWGEARAVPQMRKHLGYYLKGFAGASELRERVMRTETAAETLRIVAAIARLEAERRRANSHVAS